MEKLSIKNALKDLLHLNCQLTPLVDEYPKYKEMIDILTAEDYMSNEYKLPIPTITSISKKTGAGSHIIRRQIKEMHEIMFSTEKPVLTFNEVEYWFYVVSRKKHMQFMLKELPIIPREGEEFYIPFFQGIGIRYSLHVDKIEHSFEGKKQVVSIWLKSGTPNKYIKLRKDRAEALAELPREGFWELGNYNIESMLRRRELQPW